MKVGLVLEGGGMRGLYTCGVLDVFMQRKLEFDAIMGVSAGALFGANYKSRQMGRTYEYNLEFLNDKRYMGIYSLITTGNVMNKEFCFDELINKLYPFDYKTFRETREDFYVVVTNIRTGKPEYLKLDNLDSPENIEKLRASASLPFMSHPVEVGSKLYLDGGVGNSLPVDKMLNMGYDKVVVVLTRPLDYRKQPGNEKLAQLYYHKYPRFVVALNRRYRLYNSQVDRIIELEKQNKVFVIRPSAHIDIKRLEKDINVIKRMYNLGTKDTYKCIKDLENYMSSI
ncbi:MAG: patatin family protein [Lachnospiraceae bacterium]|nr:patatin family protein [Lachnospiraceae bacterium]